MEEWEHPWRAKGLMSKLLPPNSKLPNSQTPKLPDSQTPEKEIEDKECFTTRQKPLLIPLKAHTHPC